MRIKSFTAPNTAQAMNMIRQELGDEAVIISNDTMADGQIYITAAIEDDFEFDFNDEQEVEVINRKNKFDDSIIRESLDYHGTIDIVRDRILANVRKLSVEHQLFDDRLLLELCFGQMFNYSNILELDNTVKLFMGTPGSGKSTAIAKTATQAKIKNINTCIISTDNVRAGANNQLEAFAKILQEDFFFCKDERNLYETTQKAKEIYDLILIDTPGINPFIKEQVAKVANLSEVVKSDAILTLDAGKNTFEAVEIAEVFMDLGAKYILPTRLDLTRRIGSLLSVANCCNLSFCSASVSSSIANGLANIDNKSLAKLILA